jgi:DNA replication factor GINS
MPMRLGTINFRFENSLVKIVANKNYPEINLAGIKIGPLEEGNEYSVHYWIGRELVQKGIVHFREEDTLEATKLYKVQWKERVQVPGQISELAEDFYPLLRRYLSDLKEDLLKKPEKMQEYEKAKQLASDIVNSRLKKVIALSSGPIQSDQVVKKLSNEEKLLYEQLRKIISEWKSEILEPKTKRA